MNTRKQILLSALAIAALLSNFAAAIQVGNPSKPWSSHSYEQTAPAPVQVVKEDKPIIIHTPPLEIPSNKNFHISAIIKDMGPGSPIIHYRFGDTQKYYTRLMHQEEPQIYSIEILSAALIDNKIDYYFEVSTGSKSLATLGTEADPLTVKIQTSGLPGWAIISGILALIGVLAIRPAFRWSANKSEEKKQYEPVFKTSSESRSKKYSKIK
jgi:hypothetical protein